jgi:hypothetical protein
MPYLLVENDPHRAPAISHRLQSKLQVRLGGSSLDLDSPKGQRGEGRQAGSNGQVEVALAGGPRRLRAQLGSMSITSVAVRVGTKQWRQLSVRTASGISGSISSMINCLVWKLVWKLD